jgi:peptidyl-prolyl cis-trans isomerase C
MKFYAALACGSLAGLMACTPKAATTADAAAVAKPVATVNGVAIARETFDYYIKSSTGKSAADLTVAQREQALDGLISAEVASQQAAKDGLDKKGDAAAMMALSRWQALESAAAETYLKDRKATEAELKAEYDTQVAAIPKSQYKAHHILVKTEAEAQAVLARLKKGEKFEAVAKAVTMDPSGKTSGGDLGDWFAPTTMVKPFAEALTTMKKGETTSTPVQTEFGFHVIRLDDVRESAPPPFDSVKDRLQTIVQQKKFKSYVDELQKSAKIEKTL